MKRDQSHKQALEDAIRARDKYVAENPEARRLQLEIDLALEGLESPKDRLFVLLHMLRKKAVELKGVMESLRGTAATTSGLSSTVCTTYTTTTSTRPPKIHQT